MRETSEDGDGDPFAALWAAGDRVAFSKSIFDMDEQQRRNGRVGS